MTDEPARIRVFAVDDHPLLREGIATLVNSQQDMTVVAQASTGREAIQEFGKSRPDVTLMDLRLPDMSGIDAMIAIRADFPEARILVLTTSTALLDGHAHGPLMRLLPESEWSINISCWYRPSQ